MKLLVDHDIEAYAILLWGSLLAEGWLKLVEIDFIMLTAAGLPCDSNDRDIWRYAQANDLVLLTNNRNMEDEDSLEKTIRRENTADAMPVLTLSDVQRLDEKTYRDRCNQRIVEIALDIESYLGTGRIYIPQFVGGQHRSEVAESCVQLIRKQVSTQTLKHCKK